MPGAAHLALFQRVRAFQEIRVASRDPEHAARLAATSPGARAAASFQAAVDGSRERGVGRVVEL